MCPALVFFDTATSAAERRYKRPVLPERVSNEEHAKQLEEIEHRLWVLCDYFKVLPGEEDKEEQQPQKSEEKPPEKMLEKELTEIMTALDPKKAMQAVVERALRNETDQLLSNLKKAKQPEPIMMKMFDMARLVQISKEAEQAQAKVPLAQFDHSYSVLTEIKTTIITVSISKDATSTTTFRDQYGVPWQIRLRNDTDWLIADIDSSQCRGVMGRLKLLVRFHHESPLKSFSCSVEMVVSRIRTIYCGTLCSVSQLRKDGYFAADGTLKLRVAVIPMDPDAERSTLMCGKKLKQIPANHNANRMPKFTEGQLTITDFLNSHTTQSQPLLDANRTAWRLEVKLNQGDNERERMHMAVSIGQCDGPATTPDTCHEYFVELLTVDANGWSLRNSGRMLKGSVSMPEFLPKSRVEIYLKDGKLRLRWGIRRIPIR